jgi:hypothetical protein
VVEDCQNLGGCIGAKVGGFTPGEFCFTLRGAGGLEIPKVGGDFWGTCFEGSLQDILL